MSDENKSILQQMLERTKAATKSIISLLMAGKNIDDRGVLRRTYYFKICGGILILLITAIVSLIFLRMWQVVPVVLLLSVVLFGHLVVCEDRYLHGGYHFVYALCTDKTSNGQYNAIGQKVAPSQVVYTYNFTVDEDNKPFNFQLHRVERIGFNVGATYLMAFDDMPFANDNIFSYTIVQGYKGAVNSKKTAELIKVDFGESDGEEE